MTTKRILPADIYDTLEFTSLVYGGIGRGEYAVYGALGIGVAVDGTDAIPRCVFGHLAFASGVSPYRADYPVAALRSAAISPDNNDQAVRRINARRNRDSGARVSFADWCAELGVERGE